MLKQKKIISTNSNHSLLLAAAKQKEQLESSLSDRLKEAELEDVEELRKEIGELEQIDFAALEKKKPKQAQKKQLRLQELHAIQKVALELDAYPSLMESEKHNEMPKEIKNSLSSTTEKSAGLLMEEVKKLFLPAYQEMRSCQDKSLVLFIGVTGAGKSTTINYLVGTPLEGRRDKKTNKYFIDVKGDATENTLTKIGHSAKSETLYPKTVIDPTTQLAFCDCPGFEDNRSPEKRLCADISLQMAVRMSGEIRGVVICMDYPSLEGRGLVFINLMKILKNIFKDISLVKNSIQFAITKIPHDIHEENVIATLIEFKAMVEERVKEEKDNFGRLQESLQTKSYSLNKDNQGTAPIRTEQPKELDSLAERIKENTVFLEFIHLMIRPIFIKLDQDKIVPEKQFEFYQACLIYPLDQGKSKDHLLQRIKQFKPLPKQGMYLNLLHHEKYDEFCISLEAESKNYQPAPNAQAIEQKVADPAEKKGNADQGGVSASFMQVKLSSTETSTAQLTSSVRNKIRLFSQEPKTLAIESKLSDIPKKFSVAELAGRFK